MNLIELLGGEELQQDLFSTSNFTFGENSQIKVVGFAGRIANAKMYIVRCDICRKDPEMFGEGYFKINRGNINSGRIPCGCSKTTKYTESQFATICKRILAEHDCEFIGFHGEFNGQKSKIEASCSKHGVWTSTWVNSLMSSKSGCPVCRGGIKKPDEVMIESFMKSGSFIQGTKFKRAERKNRRGAKDYWTVYCPICDETGISTYSNLQQGKKCCSCKGFKPDKAYINFIVDSENYIALKFGVSHDPNLRIKTLNSKCVYDLINFCIYQFTDTMVAKEVENACRRRIKTGVLSKEEITDGWTETAAVSDLDKILEIFNEFNGTEIYRNKNLNMSGQYGIIDPLIS